MTTSYAKIEITGTLTVLTGLQIGAGDGFSAIGAVDKPVVRDPLSRLPMIPGTSLKGKVRTLLSRQYGADTETFYRKPNEDHAHIRRLFGDTEEYMTGRLVFRDTKLTNKDDLEARGAKTHRGEIRERHQPGDRKGKPSPDGTRDPRQRVRVLTCLRGLLRHPRRGTEGVSAFLR